MEDSPSIDSLRDADSQWQEIEPFLAAQPCKELASTFSLPHRAAIFAIAREGRASRFTIPGQENLG